MKTIILIPTYNERENVSQLIGEIFEREPDVFIFVIDDNSPDGTADAVRDLMSRYKNLSLISRARKEGLGAAYKEGMERALQDPEVGTIITMDADGSHAARYLTDLRKAGGTYDLVIGSRYIKGGSIENWEPWRYALSKYGNIYARALTGLPIRDMTSGFMCFKASVLRSLNFSRLQASGYAFLMELKFSVAHTLAGNVKEVPITFMSRREGESKISRHIIREGLRTPWRLFFRRFHARRR